MKRGKRFVENNNIYIYMGTVIFFVLAIALGIIMYMLSRTTAKIQNNAGQVAQEQQIEENLENVSTEIGKTVEETKKESEVNNSTNSNEVNAKTNTTEEKNTNTSTSNNKSKSTDKATSAKTSSQKQENVNTEKTEQQNSSSDLNNKTAENETKKEVTFVKPTEGEVICEFAKDNLIYSETLKEWITHTAVDIKADKTSVIKSAADGIVRSIVNDPRYGLTIVIEHDDGYETVYSNLLTAEFVVEGEEVKQGQTIGTAGNTASFESSMESHLHFELLKDGECVDPMIYIK